MRSSSWVVAALCCGVMLGCSDSGTDPEPGTDSGTGPSLTIVRGGRGADTIGTIFSDELVVEVRGEDGKPESEIDVVFDGPIPNHGPGTISPFVWLGPLGSVYIEDLRLAMKTDSQGRAIVRIAFGHIAGKSKVTVGVPVYGVVDSAIYTILPGAGVAARFANHDTAIAVGATLELSAGVVDRIGNLRDDPVTFDVSAGEIAIDGSGSVKGLAIGQAYARIRAEVGGALLRDSIKISVVPKGRLAVTQLTFDGVTIRGFAGEDPHGISIRRAMAPDWSPSGDQIAYVTEGRLGVTDTLGNSEILPTPGIDNATWPQYSADGRWLYFHGTVEQSTQLFRIHPDGTGLESVAEPVIMGAYPSPSPDGVSIVYTSDSAGGVLAVLDIAAGTVRTLPGTGRARMPRWSPSGEWIAYSTLDYEQTMLIRPDGTGHHLLIGKGGQSFDWSPDSRWIIIVQPHSTWLVNVETAEGLEIPGWFEYVSWRP